MRQLCPREAFSESILPRDYYRSKTSKCFSSNFRFSSMIIARCCKSKSDCADKVSQTPDFSMPLSKNSQWWSVSLVERHVFSVKSSQGAILELALEIVRWEVSLLFATQFRTQRRCRIIQIRVLKSTLYCSTTKRWRESLNSRLSRKVEGIESLRLRCRGLKE